MTASSVLELLLRAALACSMSIVLALLLRRPVRAVFGAGAAWQLWLMVPAAMLAAALPSIRVQQAMVVAMVPQLRIETITAPIHASGVFSAALLLLAAWLCGGIGTAIYFNRSQRSFIASLGQLALRDGLWYAANASAGPALLGLRDPKIVVPADFNTRYNAVEQALVIEHERRHAQRRDPLANAVIALVRCVFWFNPLVHAAASRCRFDQELACDADVMRHQRRSLKAYAAALLKTQEGAASALATCHWQSTHPLKERIMNLNQPVPIGARRLAGRLIIAGLLCATAFGAVVARAGPAAAGLDFDVTIAMPMNGKISVTAPGLAASKIGPRVLVREGEQFSVRTEHPEGQLEGQFKILDAGDGKVWIHTTITKDKVSLGQQKLLAKLGATSTVRFTPEGGKDVYALIMTVNQARHPSKGGLTGDRKRAGPV